MTGSQFRHLSEDQLGAYIDVDARSRVDHPYERRLTLEEARVWTLADPDFDPEGSWVAYLDGEAIGFAEALIEKNRLAQGMNEGSVEVEVVPEHRGKGIEGRLLDLSLGHLRSKGITKARARCVVSDVWKRSLLEPHSFEEEYRVYILVRRGRSDVRPAPAPAGLRIHRKPFAQCSNADIATAVETFNESFQDHFNFAPERPERWVNFRDSAKDIGILTLAMEGDAAVGICVSEESKAFNEERGVKAGWVDILGVRPQHRRRGIAKALLADGVAQLLEKGLDTVYIGVYAKNEKALDLYKSFGFEKDGESIWYAKKLV